MRWKIAATATISVCILSSFTAVAHHSVAANFDQSKAVDVVGKIKEIAIRNPHSQITLEVKNPGGGATEFGPASWALVATCSGFG